MWEGGRKGVEWAMWGLDGMMVMVMKLRMHSLDRGTADEWSVYWFVAHV